MTREFGKSMTSYRLDSKPGPAWSKTFGTAHILMGKHHKKQLGKPSGSSSRKSVELMELYIAVDSTTDDEVSKRGESGADSFFIDTRPGTFAQSTVQHNDPTREQKCVLGRKDNLETSLRPLARTRVIEDPVLTVKSGCQQSPPVTSKILDKAGLQKQRKETKRREKALANARRKEKYREDYISTQRPVLSEPSIESDSSAGKDYLENIMATEQSDGTSGEDDETFAELVQEYRSLMHPSAQKDLDWQLDEDAARILRDRKASDPRYTDIPQEEFDEIICFKGIYGVRSNRNLQDRLRRLGIQDDDIAGTSASRSKKYPPLPKGNHYEHEDVNFRQLNRDIKEFVRHEDVGEEMELEPYPPVIRKFVHELAHVYGLQSKSNGKGVERHCVLVKCENTRLPRDLKRLDRFLDSAQKAAKWAFANPKNEKDKKKSKPKIATPAAARVTPGTIVGAEAAPIEEDNVGNKMLRKLGWSPGQGLGSSKEGRTEPVEAVFRGNRTGLGH
jgi:hypothetical protein